jgi:hypothetical protein
MNRQCYRPQSPINPSIDPEYIYGTCSGKQTKVLASLIKNNDNVSQLQNPMRKVLKQIQNENNVRNINKDNKYV